MKLYDFNLAPNPRRVRMFLAEKGVDIPLVEINTREFEQFSDEYQAKCPQSVVPMLELDDGTCITESVAICRYIEETNPEPPLMGRDTKDRAIVEMWNRRAELEGYQAAGEAVRNGAPMFKDRGIAGQRSGVPQIPELVTRGKQSMVRFFNVLDAQLADNAFVAGKDFTIADITAFVTIEFAKRGEIEIPAACKNVARWHADVAARPSADA
jgi:glutathione S-transferase